MVGGPLSENFIISKLHNPPEFAPLSLSRSYDGMCTANSGGFVWVCSCLGPQERVRGVRICVFVSVLLGRVM